MEAIVSVVDVVEGLVREYLVKQGLQKTLESFNSEKPKTELSITKRDTLRKALGLDRASSKYKAKNPGAELPPTLALWVEYQMSKLNNFFEGVQPPVSAQAPRQRVSSRQALEEEPEEASVPEGPPAGMGAFGRRRPSSALSNDNAIPGYGSTGSMASGTATGGFMAEEATSSSNVRVDSAACRMAAMDVHEPDSGSSPIGSTRSGYGHGTSSPAPAARAGYAASPTPAARSPAPLPPPRSPAPAAPPAPAASPPAAPRAAPPSVLRPGMTAGRPQGEMVMEDVDDLDLGDLDAADLGPAPMGVGRGGTPVRGAAPGAISSGAGGVGVEKGTPLAPDTARAVRQLLWGQHGSPPASWQQGFFFSKNPGLQFGLVQKEGGPCGLLAGVQAHVLSALSTPAGGFNLTPSALQQRAALVSALADALWAARKGPVATFVSAVPEMGVAASSLGYDQLVRAMVTHSAQSKDQLADLLRANLGLLMDEAGWGLVLVLTSIVLCRGIAAVRGDMDEQGNALMGAHGYCTQELVNLVLTGEAATNVFDGVRDLDGHVLRGITRRCRLGLLTLFEWYKYVEVGPSLKTPDLPVWVVCSESHFTVLFAQDAGCLRVGAGGGPVPFDLLYYDELANQEDIIRLTVSKDPRGGWTARVGDTIGDRGKCEGQNIPPLECVIETRWPGVKVNWNGHEPIL